MDAKALKRALSSYARFTDDEGTSFVEYVVGNPLPHVQFTRANVAVMLERAINHDITLEELAQWANLISLLDAFDLSPDDGNPDEVWDVLDRAAHPQLSGMDEDWKLRDLCSML
jgi:hypothetical protein